MENLEKINRSKYNFWKGKKVLVTGHTGFKGAWLVIWLNKMGAKVSGISLKPKTKPNLYDLCNVKQICKSYIFDIRNQSKLLKHFKIIKPEIVFHLAAQSIVRDSYINPLDTVSTNVMGTTNILEVIRLTNTTKVGIMITTDKVYMNLNKKKKFKESDTLGGHDLYSGSKASCELIIESYRKSFFKNLDISISSARAGNVIGGGDWSKNRLIPDIVRSFFLKKTLSIRNSKSVRPWQHVLDTLSGYLCLAKLTWVKPNLSGPYNFAPVAKSSLTVKDIIKICTKFMKFTNFNFKNINKTFHETSYLNLNPSKTKKNLNFKTKWSTKHSIEKSLQWYFNQKKKT